MVTDLHFTKLLDWSLIRFATSNNGSLIIKFNSIQFNSIMQCNVIDIYKCAEIHLGGGVLSPFVYCSSPLLICHCDVMYVAICPCWATSMM